MKKNAILLLITILLLVLTFMVKENQFFSQDLVFKKKELLALDQIIFPHFSLVKRKGNWYYEKTNLLADPKKVLHFFEILSELKVEDQTAPLKRGVTLELVGAKKKYSFLVGEFSRITGRLAIELNGQSSVVSLGHAVLGVFSNELALAERLYQDLAVYLEKERAFLQKNYIHLPSQTNIIIKRKDSFQVDLKNNTTEPAAFSGIEYQKDLFSFLQKKLELIEVIGVWSQSIDQEKVASLFVDDKEYLTLYQNPQNKDQALMKDHFLNKTFIVTPSSLQVFFLKVDDFWNKVPIDNIEKLNQIKVVLSQKEKRLELSIPNTEQFKIHCEQAYDSKRVLELFKILFAISPYEQAYSVATFDHIRRGPKIKVELREQAFYLTFQGKFITLWDTKRKLLFNYLMTDGTFKGTSIDQFFQE